MANETRRINAGWDYSFLLIVLVLAGFGLVMVYSASSMLAEQRHDNPLYFFRPQVFFVLLGLCTMIVTRYVPYQFWTKLTYPLMLITVIGLVLVLIPGIGHRAGGASRWLRFGPVSFQPSELAKLTMAVYLAYSLTAKQAKIKFFAYGLFPHLIVLGFIGFLVILEKDLGAAVVLTLISLIMFFVAGVRVTYLGIVGAMTAIAGYLLIISSPYRLKRLTAFLSPWDDPQGTGYHIIHSFMAFASGGLTGMGPGAGQQKLFFLPEPHTDFIFSVLAEELGFIGVTVVAILFLVLVAKGLYIALNSYELEGTYLALGLTLIIGIQAFMNMAVVVGLLPTKGLILPFFSYGGSAMLVNFACVGIILNVASQGRKDRPKAREAQA